MTSAGTYTYEIGYNPVMGVVTRARGGKKGVQGFLSVDPLTSSYPMLTPYQFASNTPIQATDLDGLEADYVTKKPITVEVVGQVMSDKEISYRQNYRFMINAGYGFQEAHKFAQLAQGSYGSGMAGAFADRVNSGAMPNISGNVSFPNANGLDDFAGNVAAGSAYGMGAALIAPLASAFSGIGGGQATMSWLFGGTATERLAAGAFDAGGQILFNPASKASYDYSSTISAIAMPNRYFISGLGAGVDYTPVGKPQVWEGFSFDAQQGIITGIGNSIGGRAVGSLFTKEINGQASRVIPGAVGYALEALPNLPIKAIESAADESLNSN